MITMALAPKYFKWQLGTCTFLDENFRKISLEVYILIKIIVSVTLAHKFSQKFQSRLKTLPENLILSTAQWGGLRNFWYKFKFF
jgi:hypothetical protein